MDNLSNSGSQNTNQKDFFFPRTVQSIKVNEGISQYNPKPSKSENTRKS